MALIFLISVTLLISFPDGYFHTPKMSFFEYADNYFNGCQTLSLLNLMCKVGSNIPPLVESGPLIVSKEYK